MSLESEEMLRILRKLSAVNRSSVSESVPRRVILHKIGWAKSVPVNEDGEAVEPNYEADETAESKDVLHSPPLLALWHRCATGKRGAMSQRDLPSGELNGPSWEKGSTVMAYFGRAPKASIDHPDDIVANGADF